MKFLFDDESFSFEALRATGFADYGGAELGEVLVTCRQIPEGDEAAWSAQWAATAARVERNGRSARAARGCLPASQCAAPAAALPGMGLKYDDRFTHTHLGDRPEANGVPGG